MGTVRRRTSALLVSLFATTALLGLAAAPAAAASTGAESSSPGLLGGLFGDGGLITVFIGNYQINN